MSIDFAPHNMTSNNEPSPYVVTANTSWFPPFYAFSTDQDYWIGNSPNASWLKIDLGIAMYLLENYSLEMNTIPEPARAPKDWIIYGSVDDTNWDALDTVTGQTSWASGETRNFVCDVQSGFYRYFKIEISANNGDGGYTQIKEMYMYGYGIQVPLNYLKYRGRNRMDMGGVSAGY